MTPAAGERLLRYVGDLVRVTLQASAEQRTFDGWRAFLRTNLGRGEAVRAEVIRAHTAHLPTAGASWRDIPLEQVRPGYWTIEFPLHETGFYRAKAYALDPEGRQHWPDGPDLGISIHPDGSRSANVIYCAFTRLYGETRPRSGLHDPVLESQCQALEKQGYATLPPSGKLRDLARAVPHIMDTLGCRVLHLLPINPTPTTYARMGRYGSPYAALDFTQIDPALVEFDRRATAVEQFGELVDAVHLRGGRLFLDLAINHTGWGSTLQDNHPEWFLREPDGRFASPGAWGNTWEDLVELDHHDQPGLWDVLAEAFLTWCRRGVDGFRCDAGYKVPLSAWQYIIARAQREFPRAIFLLEGLGGAWEATEQLLGPGGMQWAYSELFQNYSGREVAGYLDYGLRQSQRMGIWVHYSETHDNPRLAARGRAWSLLRNRLCALTSVGGAFGYTGGVEWLASERIDVHRCAGLNWGCSDNIIPELAQLSRLLSEHPCFFDGARLTRLSEPDAPVYVLRRDSKQGLDQVLVLVNTDDAGERTATLPPTAASDCLPLQWDLLSGQRVEWRLGPGGEATLRLPAAQCLCLALEERPRGLAGARYREAHAQAAFAVEALAHVLPSEQLGSFSWVDLAALVVEAGPAAFLSALAALDPEYARRYLLGALRAALGATPFPNVVSWSVEDCRRITPVPPLHWLLLEDTAPFRSTLTIETSDLPLHRESIAIAGRHYVAYPPPSVRGDARLAVKRCGAEIRRVAAEIRFLDAEPPATPWRSLTPVRGGDVAFRPHPPAHEPAWDLAGVALLTNGRGGMARLRIDLGGIQSKYDCLLGANLHPDCPVDRHVFIKRARVWVNADGFLSPLDGRNLQGFSPGPPASWRFVANAGDGRCVEIQLRADMVQDANTTVLCFHRPLRNPPQGAALPDDRVVSLTVRVDLEDRNFHWETHRNEGADSHFGTHTHPLSERPGFRFSPAADRALEVFATGGAYHPQPEWCQHVPHPVEASRGQCDQGDAFSPGWFELPIAKGETLFLVATAEAVPPTAKQLDAIAAGRTGLEETRPSAPPQNGFGAHLAWATRGYLARRGSGRTVIAGYPWFLDWGRDSLICARGLLAAGYHDEVRGLLRVFGRFAEHGTLPNTLNGDNASNRDTSDAPLWFCLASEEAAAVLGHRLYEMTVGPGARTLGEAVREIALGYLEGTPNGIAVDPASGLVWSPSHFTWMDTNHPAGTPREGYPVEIQALWIRALRQVASLQPRNRRGSRAKGKDDRWSALAAQAQAAFERHFWLEDRGYLADVLFGARGVPAERAQRDNALRPNGLIAVALGVASGERARSTVAAARRHLVVPGALRSLAPLPVSPPLPIYGAHGQPLNNPAEPYQGRYEGDEDTRRKPAYHNGTAWTWTYPAFCEALARAWEFSAPAVAAARAYLGAMARLLTEGCAGHLPEIVDGDAPHTQRGCDAQAWAATEAYRVWHLLQRDSASGKRP